MTMLFFDIEIGKSFSVVESFDVSIGVNAEIILAEDATINGGNTIELNDNITIDYSAVLGASYRYSDNFKVTTISYIHNPNSGPEDVNNYHRIEGVYTSKLGIKAAIGYSSRQF